MTFAPTIERSWIEVVSDSDPDPSYLYQEGLFEERRAEYERGGFGFVGVRACAEIRFKTPQGSWTHGPVVRSPGLWGIEDDSGEDYLREVAEDELHELASMLEALNCRVSPDTLKRNSDLRYAGLPSTVKREENERCPQRHVVSSYG